MSRFILILLLFPITSFGQSISLTWGTEIEVSDADNGKIEAIYNIDVPKDSNSLYLEFKAGDQRVKDFAAYLNGKKIQSDLSAEKMTPIKVNSSSAQLKVTFKGRTGSKVTMRLTDLANYETLVGPEIIEHSKSKPDYQKTFTVDTTGEYLIVAEPTSKHGRESLRHIYLNGARIFHDDCSMDFIGRFHRTEPGNFSDRSHGSVSDVMII